jgi:hypothetical protein
MDDLEWKELLRLFLAQRLELNVMASALKEAGILTDWQIREMRKQASDTATAWAADEGEKVLRLIRVHGAPAATMGVPRPPGWSPE